MSKNTAKKVSVPLERSFYFLHPFNSCLITSRGKNEEINVMTVAWIIPVSVSPPLLAMSIRPERYSYDLIMETKEFAVNIPTFELAQKVLLCGRRSGREHEKLKEASLSTKAARSISVPIIDECIAHIECKLVQTVPAGDHILFIGQIVSAYASEGYFSEIYDMSRFHPCLHVGKNFFTTCINETIEPKLNQNNK